MKLTKIVCTLGPSSDKKEILEKMVEAGMNVARLNCSHGDHTEKGAKVDIIRQICKERDTRVAILLDTKGPELRTGKLTGGAAVELTTGQDFIFTTEDILGDNQKVSVSYKSITRGINVGQMILVADGSLNFKVKEVRANELVCETLNSGKLGEQKNMNLPGVIIDLPALLPKDIEDMKFACQQGLDFIAASFIRKKADVQHIRQILDENGGKYIKIISKIENQEGLDNFDEILEISDGIMVARGDLGMEIPVQKIPFAQKMMIKKCNEAGKVVITATQMLESMTGSPRPTRAEVTDVANAILDGTDAIMLSGETAGGKFPLEAVEIMRDISLETDEQVKHAHYEYDPKLDATEAIAKATVEVAKGIAAKLIITASVGGTTAKKIRKYFPKTPILVITPYENVARQVMAVRGCYSSIVTETNSYADFYEKAKAIATKMGLAKIGDTVVVTTGGSVGGLGITDMLKIMSI